MYAIGGNIFEFKGGGDFQFAPGFLVEFVLCKMDSISFFVDKIFFHEECEGIFKIVAIASEGY